MHAGLHGFLALEDLSEEAQALGRGRASGNYGLIDQQAALLWVQVNQYFLSLHPLDVLKHFCFSFKTHRSISAPLAATHTG
jgi:hypothetical protein